MATPKKYLHSRAALLLLTVNYFFSAFISLLIVLSLTSSNTDVFTVEHRPSLGLDANTVGGVGEIIGFILFVIFSAVFTNFLSARVYYVRKNAGLVILSMGTMVILFAGIVSYYLLQK